MPNFNETQLKNLLIVTLSILFFACRSQKKVTIENYSSFGVPRMVQINDTLFCDQTEVSNFDWLFYEHSVKKAFGDSSFAYKFLKPNRENAIGIGDGEENYLRNPRYRFFPVVGLGLAQAQEYAKWRSASTFTSILERFGLIPEGSFQKGEVVNIESFFLSNPELKDKLPYIEYRIPSEEEWRLSLEYADKIDASYRKKYREYSRRNGLTENEDLPIGLSNIMRGVQVSKRRKPILKMNDNVSEIILEEGYSMGGNYFEKDPEGIKNEFEKPNAWTGFRCVGSWKKWGE